MAENSSEDITRSQSENPLMKGWQIKEFGPELDVLVFNENINQPIIKHPNEVIVRVFAASVNPIDSATIRGYGAAFFRRSFPITVGRDFCGAVTRKGAGVRNDIKIGDEVWGVIPLIASGTHAEYICVNSNHLTHKPENLTITEAASILYSGVTAWSGLFLCGGLGALPKENTTKVCVLGASGGVGSIAVQIAKAENVQVTAVCSANAIPIVEKLGADHIVDYTKEDYEQQLASYGPFNIVLDCATHGRDYAGEMLCKFDQYVTFSSPFLRNIDYYGYIGGFVKIAIDLVLDRVWAIAKRRGLIKYAFFTPEPDAIQYLTELVEAHKLKPVVDSTFNFDQTPEAFKKLRSGHLRGKVVINIANKNN